MKSYMCIPIHMSYICILYVCICIYIHILVLSMLLLGASSARSRIPLLRGLVIRTQNPLIKEYGLNYIGLHIVI